MNHFPKYFLSLFILVIYSNLQQPNTDVAENSGCKSCFYSSFFDDEKAASAIAKNSVNQNFYFGKESHDNRINFDQYDIFLENFESQNRQNFRQNSKLKNQTTKIRNKDYLDLKTDV